MRITKEPQTQCQIDSYDRVGPCTMGPWTSHMWRDDPRHLVFTLSRYKFIAKMLTGKDHVVEVGCGDAFGTKIVRQVVKSVHGIDIDPLVFEDSAARYKVDGVDHVTFAEHDIIKAPLPGTYDAAYSLDVIEHVESKFDNNYIDNIAAALKQDGILIVGTPNVTAREYSNPLAYEAHINLKSSEELRALLARRFQNVFMFSMNDEVVHTGYAPMAHYIFGMGVGLK